MAVVTATVAHKRHQHQAILCEIFMVKSLQVCVCAHAHKSPSITFWKPYSSRRGLTELTAWTRLVWPASLLQGPPYE